MTASEAKKAQWEALKDKPLSDKLKYIFTYYWPAILGCVCAIALAVTWVSTALSQNETALSGYLLNGFTRESYSGDLKQNFLEHQQIDSNTYSFHLTADVPYSPEEISENSIGVLESIVVQIFAGELDFIVADLNSYPDLTAYFADLRTVMSANQQEKWSEYFVYVERAEWEKMASDSLDSIVQPIYHLSAESLQDPVPLGIRLPTSSLLFDAYQFADKDVIFGITHTAVNVENALAFLEYITQ